MQVLKDKTRQMIYNAALSEFGEKGFKDSSMRNIAEKSSMTVGNLYRYFKNKDDLFSAVISPAFNKIIDLLSNMQKPDLEIPETFENFLATIINGLVEVHKEYRTALLILLEGSEGTPYENFREQVIVLIEKKINTFLFVELEARGTQIEDKFLARVIATSHVSAVETIFKNCTDNERIRKLINMYLAFIFKDIMERF